MGLGSTYFKIPKRKFLIHFTDDNDINSEYMRKPIQARVEEGTKITVSATVQCKIQVSSLKNFFEEYGLNWKIYPLE